MVTQIWHCDNSYRKERERERESWIKHFSPWITSYIPVWIRLFNVRGFCALHVGREAHNFTRQQEMMVHWECQRKSRVVSSCLGIISTHIATFAVNFSHSRQLISAAPCNAHCCIYCTNTNTNIHTPVLNIRKHPRPSRAAAGWHLSSWLFMDRNDAKMNSISSAWSHRPFRGDTWLLLAAAHLSRRTSPFL